MIKYTCVDCGFSCEISPVDPDRHLLSLMMNCPSSDCNGKVQLDNSPSRAKSFMAAYDLYQSAMGMGLPHQRDCSVEFLTKEMLHGEVTGLGLEECEDKNRSFINYIEVTKVGVTKRLHFGTSVKGAVIFKSENVDV